MHNTHLQYPDGLIDGAPKRQVVNCGVLHNALLVNDEQGTQRHTLVCVVTKKGPTAGGEGSGAGVLVDTQSTHSTQTQHVSYERLVSAS